MVDWIRSQFYNSYRRRGELRSNPFNQNMQFFPKVFTAHIVNDWVEGAVEKQQHMRAQQQIQMVRIRVQTYTA